MQIHEQRRHPAIAAAMTMVLLGVGSAAWAHDRTEPRKSASQEMTFAGNVIGVDINAHTITVKQTTGGAVVEMQFHVSPETRLYIAGEEAALLAQVRPGDSVTVTYESTDAATHSVKRVKKSA